MDISSIRKDYTLKSLDISDVNDSPFEQFHQWLREAISAEVLEVNAMTLSTLHADGYPNGRVVLLKELDYGFVFFSNYQSEKGQELENHPKASLTFFWPELERQVRVMGTVEKISESQSDEYFLSRPRGSQIGAWASPQSHKINSREVLEERLKEMQLRFEEEKLVRPPHWGGYRVLPHKIEFWQGRPSRLHDRILYEKNEAGAWTISRLAP
ncbi:pyridoxamine 5'-phosphate oxidase [Algoriphagus formosus]|jgi:pyridoxamine 5'-phosphate oxidase|uniref:Pyridoxine/pyridoxamine 5'-phosphate oxidase n=1 Tax=Algoriphagus formosus TaxID=2007308 RepID=A0A4R5UU81_9BACT|nr:MULTISPECIES: pyridoxamine 5'-phosphate oxidase [Algoriphagus]TDK42748.1 pyridoxamine 5'-phosphate oxidase [Algoriphagus aquimaris]